MLKMFWPLKEPFHTYTHTLPCIPGEFQVFYRVSIHFQWKMDGKMDIQAHLNGFMNGVQWLTSPVIMTGLRVHQLS